MTAVAFTSANLAYLPQALVLCETIKRHQPDLPLVLVLVDEAPSDPVTRAALESFDEVLLARDILGDEWREWLYQYDVVEACTSVKGRATRLLLQRGLDVVYLDPDCVLFGPLQDFLDELRGCSVLLTPHQLHPVDASSPSVDDEICSLAHGIYNFGMFGVRNCPEGAAFAEWWDSRLATLSVDDVARGLFTDQRWGDFVPVFFPSSAICRHPGMNVASWNLHQRPVTIETDGTYTVLGRRLTTFHFTKATGIGGDVSRTKMRDNVAAADLWRWYLARLEHHSKRLPTPAWAYGASEDGFAIATADRQAFRERAARGENPVAPRFSFESGRATRIA